MLSAGSSWKIYTRHGEINFFINHDITLNDPETETKTNSAGIHGELKKNPWYYEEHEEHEKHNSVMIGIWNSIEKIDPSVSLIWIIQVEDYYYLVVDYLSSCMVNDYRMFPNA